MKLTTILAAGAAALWLSISGASAASIKYMEGPFAWGTGNNDSAMNTAFGAGNWDKINGFDMAAFSGASFVFIEGGNGASNELASFIAANVANIQNFVSGGGHLFINAAPNEGGSFSLGFGVTLNYIDYSTPATITAAGVSAGLTAGGISTTYTGNFFSHASVSGPISSLIEDSDGGTIFGAMSYGSGFVAFGGDTDPTYWQPTPDNQQLRVNELLYVANGAVAPVPEPGTWAMIILGFAGVGAMAYRRCRKTGAVFAAA